jgi:hypothetical protein
MPEALRVIVPDSHDWTTLGTGGRIETFLKMLIEGAERSGLALTLICPGPKESIRGSVHFLPVMLKADPKQHLSANWKKASAGTGLLCPAKPSSLQMRSTTHGLSEEPRTPLS